MIDSPPWRCRAFVPVLLALAAACGTRAPVADTGAGAVVLTSATPRALAFAVSETLGVGVRPVDVVTADFDRDGRPDLATASYGSNAVYVVMNQGGGTYATPRAYDAGPAPVSIATADFDGDGKPDLTLAVGGGASVLLGNGDGSFQAPKTFAVSGTPYAIVAGDFDGDGKADLAVANDSPSVLVFLGKGDGTFQPAQAYDGVPHATMLRAADFDGDGKLDLLAFSRGSQHAVLLGGDDGTFHRAGAPSGPAIDQITTLAIAIGDFDGDGKVDVAFGQREQEDEWVGTMLGNGDGTFRGGARMQLESPSWVASITAADLDGDGKTDLAVGITRGGVVMTFFNRGDGSFREGDTYGVDGNPRGIAAVDLDGDGAIDLAVAGDYGALTLLPGEGGGSLRGERAYRVGWYTWQVATGDFDGDGVEDVASTADDPEASGRLTVRFGDGRGGLRPDVSTMGWGDDARSQLTAADVNGDGKMDLACPYIAKVALGDGHGGFGAPLYLPRSTAGYNATSILFADLDGDGKLDSVRFRAGTRSLLLNAGKGDGTFLPERIVDAGGVIRGAAAVDLDGDGKVDLAVGVDTGLSLLFGKGDGTFEAPAPFALPGPVAPVIAADLDGDGRPDLVVGSAGVTALLNTGSRSLRVAGKVDAAGKLAVRDMNGDGIPDLALLSGGVIVALGNGDGTFQPPVKVAADGGDDFALAALGRDGLPDVALFQRSSRYMRVLRNVSR